MSEIINMKLTTKGQHLKDKMELGDGTLALDITRIVAGAGQSDAPLDQTEVADPRQAFELYERILDEDRTIIKAILTNMGLATSYSMWQIGFYALDPDEGEILYRISQFPQPVYVPAINLSSWTYTPEFNFSTHNAADVVISVNPAGLALKSDVNQANDTAQQALEIAEQALSNATSGGAAVMEPFTIPHTAWQAGTKYRYTHYANIYNEAISYAYQGLLFLDTACKIALQDEGIDIDGETLDGVLRLWCDKVPSIDVVGTYACLSEGGAGGSSGGSNYVLPVASPTQLGGVKATTEEDGTLIVTGAELDPDQVLTDASDMLDDIF